MTKIINFFRGPGSGKSHNAVGLFHLMKCNHYNVEYVNEYAKELVYENRTDVVSYKIYLYYLI